MCVESEYLQPGTQHRPLSQYKNANADTMLVDQEPSSLDLPAGCWSSLPTSLCCGFRSQMAKRNRVVFQLSFCEIGSMIVFPRLPSGIFFSPEIVRLDSLRMTAGRNRSAVSPRLQCLAFALILPLLHQLASPSTEIC